jgi:hypothetical protein
MTRGMYRSPEYHAWEHIKQRCSNPAADNYHLYGARGVRVCKTWAKSFAAFFADMGPRPGPGYSIDRIDVNGDYEPANCRWATHSQQARNRRSTTFVELEGEMLSLAEAAERCGINRKTLSTRLCRGWPKDKLFSPIKTPLSKAEAEAGE